MTENLTIHSEPALRGLKPLNEGELIYLSEIINIFGGIWSRVANNSPGKVTENFT